MEAKKLSKVKEFLAMIGYGYFEAAQKRDITADIIGILELGDSRIAKAIPFVFYKAIPKKNLSLQAFEIDLEKLDRTAQKKGLSSELNTICFITLEVFRQTRTAKAWQKKIAEFLSKPSKRKDKIMLEALYNLGHAKKNDYYKKFAEKTGYLLISLKEYIQEFEMQLKTIEKETEPRIIEAINKEKEMTTKQSIAGLFSPKQAEIIYKIIGNKQLSKTEYEYYIRIVKKKLAAIKNTHSLAISVLEKKPRKK